ncbi:nucleoside hydrolase [Planctellipticum variicoloris]|uniref:nucleoside hydrolase n=1 Tax=Planctellipticum variicoloris TaxID=3064265 RepID=UPI00301356EE|nr:nucleoside hydrolase [Planctomycetaceae bacterium SH412]
MRLLLIGLVTCGFLGVVPECPAAEPVRVIFDTDVGNDVDDALALGLLHALESRGHCKLLGVTITKNDPLAVEYVDAVNTFYGRPDIPVGSGREAVRTEPSKFLPLAETRDDGQLRYPHDLREPQALESKQLLRKLLAAEPDGSVVVVQVGFFSNLAGLLDTPADNLSPLTGKELIQKKVRLLSVMAGAFQTIEFNNHYCEYNVIKDIPAAQKLAQEWPTPIIWSGFEIGIAAPYPAVSIERDFGYVTHHPLSESYQLYLPTPHERPTWDLTSVLYAVLPDRGFFGTSPAGRTKVEADGFTRFTPDGKGPHRFLTMNAIQEARVREAFQQLCSEPPQR